MGVLREAVRWEIGSIAFVFVAGSLLHFAYDWLGRSPWMAPIAAIDESVWEHLKLAFWPAAAFAAVQGAAMGARVRNFVLGKAAALTVAPLAIVLGFYGYTAVLGFHMLAADLALFVAAVALGAAASLAVYNMPDFAAAGRRAGIAVIVVWIAAFASFTFAKPPYALFHAGQERATHENAGF
jgi:hypothetical protein